MKIITVWSIVVLLSLLYGVITTWVIRYRQKKKEKMKSEWEQYWDGVFERNRNNNN
jgi:hypothetical protein